MRLVLLTILLTLSTQSAADLTFARRALYDAPFTSGIVDLNNDGYPELPGALNVPGALVSASAARLGLAPIFAPVPSAYTAGYPFPFVRLSRDTRAADLNNDGLPDIVNNVYSCNTDPFSATQLYFQRFGGMFKRDPNFELIGPIRGRGETIIAADFDNDGYLDLYIPQYTRSDLSLDNFGMCSVFGVDGSEAVRGC